MKGAQEELLEYLKNSLAQSNIQAELSRRQADSWRVIALALIVAICLLGSAFSSAIYLVAREQTQQIREIFSSDFEVNAEKTITQKVEQEASGDSASNVANTNASGQQTIGR